MAENKKESIIYESQESLYARAVRQMKMDRLIIQLSYKEENYRKAAEMFEVVGDYLDAPQLAEKCRMLADDVVAEKKEYLYRQALRQKDESVTEEDYEKAEEMFREIPEHKDAAQQAQECLSCAAKLKQKKKVRLAGIGAALIAVLVLAVIGFSSPQWKIWKGKIVAKVRASSETKLPSVKQAKEGEVAVFGEYQWYVLEKDENSAVLLMRYAEQMEPLCVTPYHEVAESTDWENCSLRKWLNGEFLEMAFTEKEQERILVSELQNEDNQMYGTSGGAKTQDKVYLLSEQEVEQYREIVKKLKLSFWLRTPGNSRDTAAYVSARADVMSYGYPVDSTCLYTCPVIRVSF